MAVSANEFWQQLTRIGAVDSATRDAWISRFNAVLAKRAESGAEKSKKLSDDATSVAQFLIANRVLTKFQSQRLVAGRGGELRIGDFLIIDRCEQTPFSRWYVGRDLRTSSDCFVYPCTDALTSSRWVDSEWLAPHAAVKAVSLQNIEIITLANADPWRGAVVSSLPSGRPLHQWAADHGTLDAATTATLGQLLANSLAAMHDVGLVHGEVRPSRVWCGDDRSLWLLRDAGRPPANPSDPPQEHRWFDDDSASELYAAPELANPNAEPTFVSDLYSLGAVLFELATGRRLLNFPFEGAMPAEVLEARELGASGDPLMRTLAFAIDPDPAARFPDVPAFARALGVVATALSPVSEPNLGTEPTSNAATETNQSVAHEPTISEPAARSSQTTEPKVTHSKVTERSADPAVTASVATSSIPNESDPTVTNEAESRERQPKSKEPSQKEPPSSDKRKERSSRVDSPSEADAEKRKAVVSAEKSPATPSEKAIPAPKPVAAPKGLSASTIAAPTAANKQNAAPNSSTSPSAAPANPPELPPKKLRKRTRRTRRGPIIIGSVASLALLAIVAILMRPGEQEPAPRTRPALPPRPTSSVVATSGTPAGGASTTKPAPGDSAAASSGYELIADDSLLWAAPWPATAKAPTLEMLPPGSQLIITLRLSRIVGDSADSRWMDWLGPELKPALEALEKRAGVAAKDIERLTIASMGSAAGSLKTCYCVTTHQPLALKAMTDTWGVSPSRTKDGQTIYSNEELLSDVFYIQGEPKGTDEIKSFVFGPAEEITLIAANEGGAIPLPRSLQQLWDTSSQDADVVAMTVPNFLFADGRELLQKYAPRSIDPLREALIPDVAGMTIAMSLVDHWYVEARYTPSGTVTPPALLQSIKPRVESLPNWADSFVIDATIDPSWKAMAIRLPQFMRVVAEQTRYGISQTLPMTNFYLPAEAAPQVALSTLLALSSPVVAQAEVATAEPETMEPLTAMQMIDRPMSVSFDQESLEFAVAAIRDEFIRTLPPGSVPPAITIIGGDLEKMGITQNQQIRNFQMREKPLRDALSELVRQANPDKSATGLTDTKQSLVWVVDTTAPADKPTILITTRPATEAKKLTLSKEFTGG